MTLDDIKAHVTEAARLKRAAAATNSQAETCERTALALVATLDDPEKAEYAKFRADFDKQEAARG